MGYLSGLGRRARETYPESRFVTPIVPTAPTVFFSQTTGVTTTISQVGELMPIVDSGAPLGFDVPAMPGLHLLLTYTGALAQPNSGQGDFGFLWPVIDGVPDARQLQTLVGGGNGPHPICGQYLIPLTSGVLQVRTFWRCRLFAPDGLELDPNDADNPSGIFLSGLVVT